MVLFRRFLRDNSGATAIEYGLIVSVLSLLVIGAMSTVAGQVSGLFDRIAAYLATLVS